MTEQTEPQTTQPESRRRQKMLRLAKTTALVILCVLPGMLLFAFGALQTMLSMLYRHYWFVLEPHWDKPSYWWLHFVEAGIGAVGMCLALVGIGKWKLWRYSLVFLSIPFSLYVWHVLQIEFLSWENDPFIVSMIVAAGVFYLVRHTYRETPAEQSPSTQGELVTDTSREPGG